jgi:hypothetical protein
VRVATCHYSDILVFNKQEVQNHMLGWEGSEAGRDSNFNPQNIAPKTLTKISFWKRMKITFFISTWYNKIR